MKRKNYSKFDLTGKQFGRLVVVKKSSFGRSQWHCKCTCGNEIDITYSKLLNGQKSCGCLEKECQQKFVKNRTTHGYSYTHLYRTWQGIKRRCTKTTDSNYKSYGAKGITICNEWENSFEAFKRWALENGYIEGLNRTQQSIDRIDGSKGYFPENCRWSTAKEQVDNRAVTTFYDYKGKQITASEFADMYGIYDKNLVYKRKKSGKSFDEILNEWNIKHNTPKNLQKLSDYAKEEHISRNSALRRIKVGTIQGVRAGKYWYVVR